MTQQISAPETQNNEENVKTAMEDIALIKRIINHAEINLRRLGWLFLVYGSATLAFLIIDNIWSRLCLYRKNSRVFRMAQRTFWSFSLLLLSGALGGVGANVANILTVCLLGFPGYAALAALSFLE